MVEGAAIDFLLGLAVLSAWLACWGFLRFGTPLATATAAFVNAVVTEGGAIASGLAAGRGFPIAP